MKRCIFSVEEANHALPLVRRVAEDVVRGYDQLAGKAREYKALKSRKDRTAAEEEQVNLLKQEMASLSGQIDGYVAELAEIGCELKDLEAGLVDFPAELDGRPVYLCWRLGEERVESWHELTAGFAGRQPLPVTVAED